MTADFCLQCSALMFGPEMPNDMIGCSTEQNTKDGLFATVLCEGCGGTQVDHTGRCLHHSDEEHEKFILGETIAEFKARQNESGETTPEGNKIMEMTDEEKKMLVRKEIAVELLRCGYYEENGHMVVDQIISDARKLVDFIYDRKTVEIEPNVEDDEDEE